MGVVEGSGELPEQVEGADLWAAVLPGQVMVPAYLVSRYAAQYRVIVDVLLEAQDTSLTGMSFDEIDRAVSERLGLLIGAETSGRLLAEFALDSRLGQLTLWQVV